MSRVNTRDKTIVCKVVYYGPGLGGKTTSLQAVHQILDPSNKVKLISLKTDEERTLFFDFLPIDLGMVGGYRINLQAYTVPGQVQYNLTRKYLLMGADGVVFVADSQASRAAENQESLENLEANLKSDGVELSELPFVMQFNKRDLADVTPLADMGSTLGREGVPNFATSATNGEGVFDAFMELTKLIVNDVVAKYDPNEDPADVAERAGRYLQQLQAAQGS